MAAIFLVIGGLIIRQELIIRHGEITILETRPIDPRDLLRGEYVILRYAIENDAKVREAARKDDVDGSKIYIELEENRNGVATVKTVYTEKPKNMDGLFIIGEVRQGAVRFPSLEQYYVPEGSGTPIENLNKIYVEISLKNGKSRIVRLLDESLNEINPRDYLK